jgi:hypothetical protein
MVAAVVLFLDGKSDGAHVFITIVFAALSGGFGLRFGAGAGA